MNEDIKYSGTERYGRRYWCIKSDLSKDGEIYVMGNRLDVTPAGALVVVGAFQASSQSAEGPEQQMLVLAPGRWTAAYAASLVDGAPVAVEHWQGEAISPGSEVLPRPS